MGTLWLWGISKVQSAACVRGGHCLDNELKSLLVMSYPRNDERDMASACARSEMRFMVLLL